jgi:hypothetical protein
MLLCQLSHESGCEGIAEAFLLLILEYKTRLEHDQVCPLVKECMPQCGPVLRLPEEDLAGLRMEAALEFLPRVRLESLDLPHLHGPDVGVDHLGDWRKS